MPDAQEYSIIMWLYKSVVDEEGMDASMTFARLSFENSVAGIGGRVTGILSYMWSEDFAERRPRYAIRVSAIVEPEPGTNWTTAVTDR